MTGISHSLSHLTPNFPPPCLENGRGWLRIAWVQSLPSGYRIYIIILFSDFFPYRLLQNIEYTSLCYTVGPCCLPILYIVVCICQSQSPNLSLPPPFFPFGNHQFVFYVCESLSVANGSYLLMPIIPKCTTIWTGVLSSHFHFTVMPAFGSMFCINAYFTFLIRNRDTEW